MISRIQINSQDIKCENLGEIEFNYAQSSEAACFQVVEEMKTKLLFIGSAYDEIVAYTSDICASNTLDIYEMCDGVESLVFTGLFTLTSCEFNYDLCSVFVEIEPNNLYNCILKNWEIDANILQTPIDSSNNGTIEYPFFNNLEYITSQSSAPVAGYGSIGSYSANNQDPNGPDYFVYVLARVVSVTGCLGGVPKSPDSNPAWYLVTDSCSIDGTATWARPAIIGGSNPDVAQLNLLLSPTSNKIDFVNSNTGVPGPPPFGATDLILMGFEYIDLGTINQWQLPIGTYTFYAEITDLFGSTTLEVDNGRNLTDVIQYLLDQQSCGLTFKSSFYGTSGFENSPNSVTGLAANPMSGLMVFQKSDVADYSATENATIANISLSTITQDLNAMHNVWWQIDEDTNEFVIEHWSTLNNLPLGIDLTVDPYRQYSRNNNTVSYNREDQPKKEDFAYAVPSDDVDFNGLGISYNTSCSATSVLKRQTQQICTDWVQVFGNPEFETEGLMLVQPDSLSPSGTKAQNGRITGVFNPNAPLGYGATLPDYYTYNRPNKEGTINNTLTVFDSTKRLKSLKEVTIPFCCSISDANVFINTFQGEGVIEEATYTPSKQILTIKTILEL